MRLSDAVRQAWPPFVLVTGLLLVGLAAHTDGLFERAGRALERLPGHPPRHPRALLIGLDLGPNLAVTGSLSAYLWLRASRQLGSRPSIAAYSRRGLLLAPAATALAAGRPLHARPIKLRTGCRFRRTPFVV